MMMGMDEVIDFFVEVSGILDDNDVETDKDFPERYTQAMNRLRYERDKNCGAECINCKDWKGNVTDNFENCMKSFKALEEFNTYKTLEEQGLLLRLPCTVGDFALFSNGDILPVVYVTMSNAHEGIIVGCQNGINISMNLQYGSWCKGFFKSRQAAENALAEMKES